MALPECVHKDFLLFIDTSKFGTLVIVFINYYPMTPNALFEFDIVALSMRSSSASNDFS